MFEKIINFLTHPFQNIMLRAMLKEAKAAQILAYNEWAIATEIYNNESERWLQYMKELNFSREDVDKWYMDHVDYPHKAQTEKWNIWHVAGLRVESLENALGYRNTKALDWPYDKEK